MIDWPAIEQHIACATGAALGRTRIRAVGGGSINAAYRVEAGRERFFVKLNRADRLAMFAAEAAGLGELRAAATGVRVPHALTWGTVDSHAFLVLEWIDMQPLAPAAMTRLGEALADLHGVIATQYGWDRNNHIGISAQANARHPRWREFWRENRLTSMLDALAPAYPSLARAGDRLVAGLDELLSGHVPEPSLVHGDLWDGNVAMDSTATPVLFDPAVYYGDRETDLAMAELFGGFSPLFFEAYWGAWPMRSGYRDVRRPLYQLYHLLNHARLFGGHYVAECRRVTDALIDRL